MKTIKQKKLTGRHEIDKYLTAGTGLREMVYIPKEMSPSRFDGYTEFISFLTHYVEQNFQLNNCMKFYLLIMKKVNTLISQQ